jgi:hypothetical protein
VWSEDDATVGCSGHETLSAAFKRLYAVPMPEPIEVYDDGDAVYKHLPINIIVCESYPGNSSIHAWPVLHDGDLVTIVLKWPNNAKDGNRLVHTQVFSRSGVGVNERFQANDDDRPHHLVADHTVTWRQGHVDLKGRESLQLLRAAQFADEAASEK